MNKFLWRLISTSLTGALMWFAVSSQAELVTDLYQVAVPVEARSAAERERAQRQGFGQIIVKVSGNSQVLARPQVRQSLAQADRYLEQFGFETRTVPSPNGILGPSEQTLLTMKFDATAINGFLRQQGIQIWAANRPRTLLWLSYDDNGQTRLVTQSDLNTEEVRRQLQRLAERRGLPLVIPKITSGAEQVRLADQIAEFNLPELKRRGASLGPDVMVVARVDSRGLLHELNGLIQFADDQKPIVVEHQGLDATLATFIERLADTMADRLAVLATAEPGQLFKLHVDGVESLADFAGLTNYLDSLIAVEKVQVEWIKEEQIGLAVTLESNRDAFLRSIALDDRLVPTLAKSAASEAEVAVDAPTGTEASPHTPVLNFRWSK